MTNLSEKFRLNFSRCTNRDVAPLRMQFTFFNYESPLITAPEIMDKSMIYSCSCSFL